MTPDARRAQLLDLAEEVFTNLRYDEVSMEDIATRAGISRALLYRHFAGKQVLFAAVYQRAADRLLEVTTFDPALSPADQVRALLDLYIDYFAEHRNTVLTANRVLAGDESIQAIIAGLFAQLRDRWLQVVDADTQARSLLSAAFSSWLVFVRDLSVQWLSSQRFSREELREICVGALHGSIEPILAAPAQQAVDPLRVRKP